MRSFPAICRTVVVVVLAVLACVPPERLAAMPTVCIFKAALGVECFGCGITRAVSAALHGDFAAALAYNPLVVVALPALIFAAVRPEALQRIIVRRRVA